MAEMPGHLVSMEGCYPCVLAECLCMMRLLKVRSESVGHDNTPLHFVGGYCITNRAKAESITSASAKVNSNLKESEVNKMYEKRNGTRRIVCSLKSIKDDKQTLSMIARLLNYNERQLKEDIQALADRLEELEEMEKENESYD